MICGEKPGNRLEPRSIESPASATRTATGDDGKSRLHKSARTQWCNHNGAPSSRYTTTWGCCVRTSLSYWGSIRGIPHLTWRISMVAGSIFGRHYWMWEKHQGSGCASRSSGGSCGRRVTQWRCVNDCYRPAKKQIDKLVNRAWSYCDEHSDSAIPGHLPISTLPMYATMQTRLTRIGIDIVNMEMVTVDEGRIPAKYQELSCPRDIQGLCWRKQQRYGNSRTARCKASKENSQGKSTVGRGWEKITGDPAVRNHTNWVDLKNLRKSEWNQERRKMDTACGSTDLNREGGRRTAAVGGQTSAQ